MTPNLGEIFPVSLGEARDNRRLWREGNYVIPCSILNNVPPELLPWASFSPEPPGSEMDKIAFKRNGHRRQRWRKAG